MSIIKRRLSTVAILLAVELCAFGPARVPASPVGPYNNAEFSLQVNQHKTVRVEVYSPIGAETWPVRSGDPRIDARFPRETCPCALVLHGAGGMFFDGPEMRRVARELAANGVRAYVVHYFDGSGVSFTGSTSVLLAHYLEWEEVVESALAYARAMQGKPTQRVGIYGYSMGAFLGIAASSDNPGVGALAEQAGGIWDSQQNHLGKMPPVLIIHGRDDRRVPFEKFAVPLEHALHNQGDFVQTLYFDHEVHVFSRDAQSQARAVAAAFLRHELAPRKSASRTGIPVRGTYLSAISP